MKRMRMKAKQTDKAVGRRNRPTGPIWAVVLAMLAVGLALPATVRAQQAQQQAQPEAQAQQQAQPEAQAQQQAQPRPQVPPSRPMVDTDDIIDESFSIRYDEDLYQLEEAVALIAGSLNKISDRVSNLAINSFHYGKGVDADFRRKAEVVILDKLFVANPYVKLVQCPECQKLETKIVKGVLRIRKGIPDQKARKELAGRLGVDGFIDIGMFTDGGQLTVYLKVVEASSGAIILVDELAGRRAPMRRAFTVSFGEMIFPIDLSGKTVDHKTLAIGFQEAVKLTGRFSFAVDVVFYMDHNENNPEATYTLDGGILLAPVIGFDILQVHSSTSRIIWIFGIGKLLDPQLDYANFARTGLDFVVGDRMSVLLGYNHFDEHQLEGGTTTVGPLHGGGYDLRFGYRF